MVRALSGRRQARHWLTGGALVLVLSGCGGATLQATQQQVETANLARVEVAEVAGEVLTFDVYNLSQLSMVIVRDKIVLETPIGRRGRDPGGVQRSYDVAPGHMHDVKVKFDLSDCPPGQSVKVLFDSALLVDGTPVPVAPVPFICR